MLGDRPDVEVAVRADKHPQTGQGVPCNAKHLLPSPVDAHVPFSDPGHAEREGYLTGTRAGA
jgi:dihydroorotase-like cyclic amidohydrolase